MSLSFVTTIISLFSHPSVSPKYPPSFEDTHLVTDREIKLYMG